MIIKIKKNENIINIRIIEIFLLVNKFKIFLKEF